VTRFGDIGAGVELGGGDARGDLRYCITHANSNLGADVIEFSVTGTIYLTATLPTLTSEIDIRGPGAKVLSVSAQVGASYRIFSMDTYQPVKISGVSIRKGSSGIWNFGLGPVTISDVIVAENTSAYTGGGIYNAGRMTLLRSTVHFNRVISSWCQQPIYGGGIHNAFELTVIDSTISGNLAHCISAPRPAYGGGISNFHHLAIINSTVVGNESRAYVEFDNFAAGGGIYNDGAAVIRDSTIADNTTGYSGGGISNEDRLRLYNSIVAGNRACSYFSCDVWDNDISGPIFSSGYNLIGDTTGGSGFEPTDLLNVDAGLNPLADNGGPTQTMALLPGSLAIDAGDPNPADPPEWDQRGPGFPRIVNGRIDIGAFEVQATGAPSTNILLAILITADLGPQDSNWRLER
jgi:hypothetical protein